MDDGSSGPTRTYVLAGEPHEAPRLDPGLYVVATPIGNLRDITIRALETLAAADTIYCEDTRTSAKLLDHYGIRSRRRALHEHNEREAAEGIVNEIAGGARIALISDAGTPLLSDPGFPLVRAVREAGLPVFAVPGPSALLAALAVAGLPTDSFSFIGFLPAKAGQRENTLADLKARRETLVFYESPRRLVESLRAMSAAFGADRPVAVALELTKRFERVHRGTLGTLVDELAALEAIRGEAVVLVGGAPEHPPTAGDWQAALGAALQDHPLREAVDLVAGAYGLKRKEVYDAALRLKTEKS